MSTHGERSEAKRAWQGVRGAAGPLFESEAIDPWRAAQGLVHSRIFQEKTATAIFHKWRQLFLKNSGPGCTNPLSPARFASLRCAPLVVRGVKKLSLI